MGCGRPNPAQHAGGFCSGCHGVHGVLQWESSVHGMTHAQAHGLAHARWPVHSQAAVLCTCRMAVLNDFEACGYGVPALKEKDYIALNNVKARPMVGALTSAGRLLQPGVLRTRLPCASHPGTQSLHTRLQVFDLSVGRAWETCEPDCLRNIMHCRAHHCFWTHRPVKPCGLRMR